LAAVRGRSSTISATAARKSVCCWSAEELHFQFPHLSLGQIHSALAYYWDHRDELERDIARRRAAVDRQQRQTPPTPLQARLRARGGR
jgi:hypothetical protein